MHPAIFQFPKEVYYHNQVQTYSSAHTQEIPLLINSKEKVQDVRPSVIFVDLDEGKAKKCDQTNSSGQNSKANISDFVEAAVSLTVALVKQNSYTLLKDIGIVTVCQEQQYHIQKEIDAVFSANNNSTSVKGKSKSKAKSQHQAGPDDLQGPVVETIGGFQGHEKSVIIFIPTFINEKGDIEATRRNGVINVGLTRAKHLLIVVAHGNALKKETRWKKWINWLQNNAPQSNVGTISIEECNAIIDSI
jgi:superfamily I DNA and/or RNA helicase